MATSKQIDQVAEQFAEHRISRISAPDVEVGLAFDVSKAMAIEVLSFALPRLGGDPGE